ncbi:MAG: response regulator [Gammaproteobacteria bacterium]|nr:response regulator [Gammaproteobacteria bacterium]
MKHIDQCSVLVVDDDEITRLMLIAVLSDICHCEAAGNAQEAFNFLAVHPVDLIVLDIQMPDMSGLEFCEKVRANNNFVKIPILFITSSVERNIQEACWIAGGNDFVKKPVISNTLKQRAENLLKSKIVADSMFHTGYDDPLTGMKTEHYLMKEVSGHLQYCQTNNQPFSMLLIKIAGIHAINEHQGFHHGNQAIQAVARVIEGQLTLPLSKCCRISGATFAISLPNVSEQQGLEFTGKVSDAMGRYLFSDGTKLPLNIRFKSSIASCDGTTGYDMDALMSQCHTALAANPVGNYLKPGGAG